MLESSTRGERHLLPKPGGEGEEHVLFVHFFVFWWWFARSPTSTMDRSGTYFGMWIAKESGFKLGWHASEVSDVAGGVRGQM